MIGFEWQTSHSLIWLTCISWMGRQEAITVLLDACMPNAFRTEGCHLTSFFNNLISEVVRQEPCKHHTRKLVVLALCALNNCRRLARSILAESTYQHTCCSQKTQHYTRVIPCQITRSWHPPTSFQLRLCELVL